jgi:hypothetical protein
MNKETATHLVTVYAESINRNFSELTQLDDHGFMGSVGAAVMQYDAANQILIVWGVISPFGYKYVARPEYLDEIKRIAKERPELTDGAEIEVKKFPNFVYGAKKNPQPWLTLRKDFNNPELTAREFIALVDHLTDLAFSAWREPEREAARTVNSKFGLPTKEQIFLPVTE